MRQVGGTLGTAVFLSVLFSTLPDKIRDAMTTYGPTNPDFRAALAHPSGDAAANAQFIEAMRAGAGTGGGGGGVNRLQDSRSST